MTRPRPNRKPFPRRYFVERYSRHAEVHEFLRDGHEDYFRIRNECGWQHDLGAQDVFLDNMGLIFQEQVDRELWDEHMRDHSCLMRRWERLQTEVLRRKPWWGKNFNSGRGANAGEPRSLLRFMSDVDLADLDDGLPALSDAPNYFERSRFDDWSPDRFLGVDGWLGERADPQPFAGGVPLPAGWSPVVDRLRILPPSAATPDLPLRLGFERADRSIYRKALRDQGNLGTCTANAVASALDIAGLRAHPQNRVTAELRVSAACLHARTGPSRRSGRGVGTIAKFVEYEPFCSHHLFPYPSEPGELQRWANDSWLPDEKSIAEDHERLTNYWGDVEVRNIQPLGAELDVPKLKAHLAAGWVVVIAASQPVAVHNSPGLNTYGTVVTPPLGSKRQGQGGHAWTLVGYDHVDGNSLWKYQGHFLAMTSWGHKFPIKQSFGPSVVAIPFSFFRSEGFEAWAFRFAC